MKNNILGIIKDNWHKIIILGLILIVYCQWIFNFNYLVAGDWIFHNQLSLLSVFYRVPQLWFSFTGLGGINIMPTFDFIQIFYGFFAHFFNYAVLERIFYFWPVLIFSYIGILKLGRYLFRDNKIGIYFFGIFFLFNTYILSTQTSFITYAVVYALSPIVFYIFIKLLNEKFNLKNVFSAALILLLCSFYEPRGLVALSYLLTIYAIYVFFVTKKQKIHVVINFICTYLIFTIFNLYWVIPNFFTSFFSQVASTNNVFVPFNSLLDSFSFHNYAWQGNILNNFSLVPFHNVVVSFYFWVVTILIFSIIFFYKKIKINHIIIFLLVSSLIGIFLLKQQNPPFGFIYVWLFYHLPTFSLFRESNKFIIFFLPISLLFGFSISFINTKFKKQITKIVFLAIVAFIVLINVIPVINKQIGTLFVNHNMSNDYVILNNFLFNQTNYFRDIVVPRDSSWQAYSILHPKISNVDIVGGNWSNFINYKQHDNDWPVQSQIVDIYNKNFSNQLFDITAIKYVIVPIQDIANDDDAFFPYGGDKNPNIRQWYIDQLDKVKWLKKIDIGTKDLVVYENEDFRDHIYTTDKQETIYKNLQAKNVDYQFINPTEYKIKLTNIATSTYLNFSEAYHFDWSLRVGNFNWFNVLTDKNYFFDGKYHFENDAHLNSFLIDPNYIKQNFDKSYYKENPDGSIDVELTLYFKPQSYFYLGIIISGTTLVGCFGYLGYDFVKRRKKRLEIKSLEKIG